MKATGIVRNVDQLGRVVLPRELRKVFGLEPGTPVEVFVADNGIFLQKYESACTFCGSNENLIRYRGRWICSTCQGKIGKK
jgi:transcriptional pleiotropic regulator of transition state genes